MSSRWRLRSRQHLRQDHPRRGPGGQGLRGRSDTGLHGCLPPGPRPHPGDPQDVGRAQSAGHRASRPRRLIATVQRVTHGGARGAKAGRDHGHPVQRAAAGTDASSTCTSTSFRAGLERRWADTARRMPPVRSSSPSWLGGSPPRYREGRSRCRPPLSQDRLHRRRLLCGIGSRPRHPHPQRSGAFGSSRRTRRRACRP